MAGTGRLWALGVGLEVVSTLSGTAGKQLIRFSELLRRRKAPALAKPFFIAGLLVNTIMGPILDMAAYSFAAQSLIAPFGGLDVIWNAALAPYLLSEQLTRSRMAACALIFAGTLLTGAFGPHLDKEYTAQALEEQLVAVRVPLYLAVLLAFVLLNILGPMRRPKGDLLRGLSLGMTAGSIAGNMFCVKAAVELIETSIWNNDGEPWRHWITYALLLGAAFFALTNLHFLTRGLLEYEALFMVTVYEGSMIVANCISAAVVLQELGSLEPWRVALYVLSVFLVCFGMFVICYGETFRASDAEDDEPDGNCEAELQASQASSSEDADPRHPPVVPLTRDEKRLTAAVVSYISRKGMGSWLRKRPTPASLPVPVQLMPGKAHAETCGAPAAPA